MPTLEEIFKLRNGDPLARSYAQRVAELQQQTTFPATRSAEAEGPQMSAKPKVGWVENVNRALNWTEEMGEKYDIGSKLESMPISGGIGALLSGGSPWGAAIGAAMPWLQDTKLGEEMEKNVPPYDMPMLGALPLMSGARSLTKQVKVIPNPRLNTINARLARLGAIKRKLNEAKQQIANDDSIMARLQARHNAVRNTDYARGYSQLSEYGRSEASLIGEQIQQRQFELYKPLEKKWTRAQSAQDRLSSELNRTPGTLEILDPSSVPTYQSAVAKNLDNLNLAPTSKLGGPKETRAWLLKQPGVTEAELKFLDLDTFYSEGMAKHGPKWRPTKQELAKHIEDNTVDIIELPKRKYTDVEWRTQGDEGDTHKYREILLIKGRAPSKHLGGDDPFIKGEQTFQSPHYRDTPNILGWARLTDRTTPDGKRVLFVEEMQSDWQKALRKREFAERGELLPDDQWMLKSNQILKDKGLNDYIGVEGPDLATRAEEVRQKSLKIPTHPLAKKYTELVSKRVMRLAAEEGYDAVGWTTGEQQAARWQATLLKNVEKLDYDLSRGPFGKLTATKPDGTTQQFSVDIYQLPKYVGEDVATKLLGVVENKPATRKIPVFGSEVTEQAQRLRKQGLTQATLAERDSLWDELARNPMFTQSPLVKERQDVYRSFNKMMDYPELADAGVHKESQRRLSEAENKVLDWLAEGSTYTQKQLDKVREDHGWDLGIRTRRGEVLGADDRFEVYFHDPYSNQKRSLDTFKTADEARKALYDYTSSARGTLPTNKITVGKGGYENVYDKQIVQDMDKIGKKYGAKSGEGRIRIGAEKRDRSVWEDWDDDRSFEPQDLPIHLLHLTPDLKTKVPKTPFNLFQVPAALGLTQLYRQQQDEARRRKQEQQ